MHRRWNGGMYERIREVGQMDWDKKLKVNHNINKGMKNTCRREKTKGRRRNKTKEENDEVKKEYK